MKWIIGLTLISFLFVVGCTEKQIGGDKDSHGCLVGAGYQWCAATEKCQRFWEEPCEQDSCVIDTDCVPLPSECHPRTCINVAFADDYEKPEICTAMFDEQAAYNEEDCICQDNMCVNKNLHSLPEDPEERAQQIATDYIRAQEEYKDKHGRNLRILEIKTMRCPGCFQLSLEYHLDSEKADYDKVSSEVNIENWEIVDVVKAYQAREILTIQECEALGGKPLNIVGGASCAEDEHDMGDVEGFISPNICCV
jgi:hypothetical protein